MASCVRTRPAWGQSRVEYTHVICTVYPFSMIRASDMALSMMMSACVMAGGNNYGRGGNYYRRGCN